MSFFGKIVSSSRSLITGWRGDISAGHTTMVGSFGVAVIQEFRGAPIEHVALWLGAGIGGYGFAKGTEMICSRKTVGVDAPPTSSADGGTQ